MTTRLSWDCAGSGEPLLLHGIGTTRDDFSALRPALEADYDVLAIDLPGPGDSPPTVKAPSIHAVTDTIEADLDTLDGPDRTPIVVDLSRVEFIGSNALAVLVDVHERASAEGRTLAVVAATRVVRRPLQVIGLDTTLSVYDDLDHALEAVHASAVQRPRHES